MKTTITEALAELKTIDKRIGKKIEFYLNYMALQQMVKDPHEKDGGSAAVIEREKQAIYDLYKRQVNIKTAIQKANLETSVTVNGVTRTVAEWLAWRKDVSGSNKQFLDQINGHLKSLRDKAKQNNVAVKQQGEQIDRTDLVVFIDEAGLLREREGIETTLGELDGKLSLVNATKIIEV